MKLIRNLLEIIIFHFFSKDILFSHRLQTNRALKNIRQHNFHEVLLVIWQQKFASKNA